MKKNAPAIITLLAVISLIVTGCSSGNSVGGEQPVFPAVISGEAAIKQGDEEYAVKILYENGATELTLLEPPEISGLKIKNENGHNSYFLGGMTVSGSKISLPNSFADDLTDALESLKTQGVPETGTAENAICVYDKTTTPSSEIPAVKYRALFDKSGALTAVEAPEKGLTAVFG